MFLPILSLIFIAGRPEAEESLMTIFKGTDFLPFDRCVKSSVPVSQIVYNKIQPLLVKKVPTPKVGRKPAFSAASLYSRHSSTFSESENTIVFFSVIPWLS